MGTIGLSPQISGSGTDKIRQSPPLLGTTRPRQKIHALFRHNPPEGRIQSAQLSTKVYTAKIDTIRPFSRIVYKKVDTIRRVSYETRRKNGADTKQTKQKRKSKKNATKTESGRGKKKRAKAIFFSDQCPRCLVCGCVERVSVASVASEGRGARERLATYAPMPQCLRTLAK